MAEVLSRLTSPSNDPTSLIHARPSASDTYPAAISPVRQPPRTHQMSRNQYNSQHTGGSGYRGTSAAPNPSYAFKTSPPPLRNDNRYEILNRNTSNPNLPASHSPLSAENSSAGNRQRYPAPSSVSTTSSSSSNAPPALPPIAKDDSILFSNFTVPSFSPELDISRKPLASAVNGAPLLDATKPSPERYRRGNRRAETASAAPSYQTNTSTGNGIDSGTTFGTGKMGQFYYSPQQTSVATQSPSPTYAMAANGVNSLGTFAAAEGQMISPKVEKADVPKRYRRRTSFSGSAEGGAQIPTPPGSRSGAPLSNEQASPGLGFPRQDSRPGSANRPGSSAPQNEHIATRNIVSADAVRRINNPSPLSQPYASGEVFGSQEGTHAPNYAHGGTSTMAQSPAVAAMAALNVNDSANKGVKSRIRRAFSFGSAQELKRATGETDTAADRARARQEQFSSELDEEQDAIARQQEAAGLGNNIYSGQGNVFTGSTDNLSISSTASSASMMLRKMGKGVKKGGRSIKGLFRPKSVIGVPAADSPMQASVGPVTMVTVEAEREQVNVNLDPHDQAGGGTGFPRLERNSLDAGRISSAPAFANNEHLDGSPQEPRRSIVGGEQDRAEVLAAVKRGILKRSGTSSPVTSPNNLHMDSATEAGSPSAFLPNIERRGSPVPSTTSSEPRRNGHRRMDSHTLEGDDYFASVPRLPGNQSTRSLPGSPRGVPRNISFSPRIQFHDVWSSTEYDRRGDIATCNRLTPMLAQQIKEELNTFKMEMEVHEQSKPHTHFF